MGRAVLHAYEGECPSPTAGKVPSPRAWRDWLGGRGMVPTPAWSPVTGCSMRGPDRVEAGAEGSVATSVLLSGEVGRTRDQ